MQWICIKCVYQLAKTKIKIPTYGYFSGIEGICSFFRYAGSSLTPINLRKRMLKVNSARFLLEMPCLITLDNNLHQIKQPTAGVDFHSSAEDIYCCVFSQSAAIGEDSRISHLPYQSFNIAVIFMLHFLFKIQRFAFSCDSNRRPRKHSSQHSWKWVCGRLRTDLTLSREIFKLLRL